MSQNQVRPQNETLGIGKAVKVPNTGSSKKNPAKFSDTCSDRADGLCIGCLGSWAEGGRGKFRHAGIFWHDPVCHTLCYLETLVRQKILERLQYHSILS